jgi:hypothetical protein
MNGLGRSREVKAPFSMVKARISEPNETTIPIIVEMSMPFPPGDL